MIKVGKAYLDRYGLHRYVVSKSNAAGRRAARVLWRRPGAYVEKLEEQMVAAFAGVVRREDSTARVDPAPSCQKNPRRDHLRTRSSRGYRRWSGSRGPTAYRKPLSPTIVRTVEADLPTMKRR
jgi:hypothetical protein